MCQARISWLFVNHRFCLDSILILRNHRLHLGCPKSVVLQETKTHYIAIIPSNAVCLQCFDTVGWTAGRTSSLYGPQPVKKLTVGMLVVMISLQSSAHLMTVSCQSPPPPPSSSAAESRMACYFSYQLPWAVLFNECRCIPGNTSRWYGTTSFVEEIPHSLPPHYCILWLTFIPLLHLLLLLLLLLVFV